jgi:hypothetical protein
MFENQAELPDFLLIQNHAIRLETAEKLARRLGGKLIFDQGNPINYLYAAEKRLESVRNKVHITKFDGAFIIQKNHSWSLFNMK